MKYKIIIGVSFCNMSIYPHKVAQEEEDFVKLKEYVRITLRWILRAGERGDRRWTELAQRLCLLVGFGFSSVEPSTVVLNFNYALNLIIPLLTVVAFFKMCMVLCVHTVVEGGRGDS
jgi:hypothetical protein